RNRYSERIADVAGHDVFSTRQPPSNNAASHCRPDFSRSNHADFVFRHGNLLRLLSSARQHSSSLWEVQSRCNNKKASGSPEAFFIPTTVPLNTSCPDPEALLVPRHRQETTRESPDIFARHR